MRNGIFVDSKYLPAKYLLVTKGIEIWQIPLCCAVLSRVQLSVTLWTVARQAPLSLEFFRQESWSGLPFPTPGIPTQGMNLGLLHYRRFLCSLSHLHQIKKLILTVTRQVVLMYLLMAQHHFCDILAKNAQPQRNHERESDKPMLENIVQNKWPEPFKHVKVMKVRKIPRNRRRLEKVKETWQLNARWCPELDLGLKKKKTLLGQFVKFEYGPQIIFYQSQFHYFNNYLWLCN